MSKHGWDWERDVLFFCGASHKQLTNAREGASLQIWHKRESIKDDNGEAFLSYRSTHTVCKVGS